MKIVGVLYGVFALFSSKISPLVLFQFISKISTFIQFFLRKTTKKGRCASHKKTLHFMKIVAVLYGVFTPIPSEISPFVLFQFMRKKSRFGHVPRIENVTFCEICRCTIGVVCSNYVRNLTFCSIF